MKLSKLYEVNHVEGRNINNMYKLLCKRYNDHQIADFFGDNLNFYFMKTAKIPVYRHTAIYGNRALSVYKINDILRCLEYIY